MSAASLWEIAIKPRIGKSTLERPFAELFPAQLTVNRFEVFPIETPHLARLVALPHHHRNPFDRLILAQAMENGLPVLTRDRAFAAHSVETIWEGSAHERAGRRRTFRHDCCTPRRARFGRAPR